MEIKVLYEDNHLLVVEKPVNVPVQEDASGDPDLLNELKAYLKEKYNKPGNVYLGLVHRLDRPVGGAIVYARTSKAASRLANELRQHKIQRKYLAVVRGRVAKETAVLENYLLKNRSRNHVSVVDKETEGAQYAKLSYRLLAYDQQADLSLLEVELATGRSHQIRVQLANLGHPLYGDQRYGQAVNQPGQQIALWAHQLAFKHPTRDEISKVESLPPEDSQPWSLFTERI